MNLPQAFTDNMKELLQDEYEDYLASYDAPRVQGLRVNTAKISVEEFLKLTEFTLRPVPWTTNGFYYEEKDAVTKHPHYYAGLYYIQEPSAMIPASRLPVEPGDKVLDLCAAPGGKATELGAKLRGTGLLVANDISNSRAKGLLKNLELFGIGNLLVTSEEPKRLLEYFPHYFDKILIDAPCSGEGMFRKDPAMVKSWEEHGPEYYAAIQKEILRTASEMLKPGGKLLYSTCTFSPLEDEEPIRMLMEENPEMQVIPMEGYRDFSKSGIPECVRVFPHKLEGEGHFAALLEKKADGAAGNEVPAKVRKKSVKLPAELSEFLANIASFPENPVIELRDDKAYLMPEGLPAIRGLRFLRTGLYLGECRKNRFEPSQALAMSLCREDYRYSISFSAKDERVLRYLKGESFDIDDMDRKVKSYVLVCVDGYPLGWGKIVNGTLRNKYYPGWRLM